MPKKTNQQSSAMRAAKQAAAAASVANVKEIARALEANAASRISRVTAKAMQAVETVAVHHEEPVLNHEFLLSMLSPEHARGACVPDFPGETARYQSVYWTDVGANTSTTARHFDGNGQHNLFVTPDLRTHIYVSDDIEPEVTYDAGRWRRNGGYFVRESDKDDWARTFSTTRVSGELLAPSATVRQTNFFPADVLRLPTAEPVTDSGQVTDRVIFPAKSVDGTLPIGLPMWSNSDANFKCRFFLDFELALGVSELLGNATVSLILQGYKSDGTAGLAVMPMVNTAAALSDVTICGNYSCYLSDAGTSGGDDLVRWTDWAVQIAQTGAAYAYPDSMMITKCSLGQQFGVIGSPAANTNPLLLANNSSTLLGAQNYKPLDSGSVFSAFPVPEYYNYSGGLSSAYRIVGCSCWVENTAAELYKNGKALALLNDSERPPRTREVNYASAAGLSAVSGAYDGPLAKGTWSIWKPRRVEDLAWRTFNKYWCFELPYITAAQSSVEAGGQSLRLRIVANWEIKTLSNTLNRQPVLYSPDELALTLAVLMSFPHTIENATHLKAIGDFFKSAFERVKRIAPKIIPLASQVLTWAPKALQQGQNLANALGGLNSPRGRSSRAARPLTIPRPPDYPAPDIPPPPYRYPRAAYVMPDPSAPAFYLPVGRRASLRRR